MGRGFPVLGVALGLIAFTGISAYLSKKEKQRLQQIKANKHGNNKSNKK
jgi:hypothetical protein